MIKLGVHLYKFGYALESYLWKMAFCLFRDLYYTKVYMKLNGTWLIYVLNKMFNFTSQNTSFAYLLQCCSPSSFESWRSLLFFFVKHHLICLEPLLSLPSTQLPRHSFQIWYVFIFGIFFQTGTRCFVLVGRSLFHLLLSDGLEQERTAELFLLYIIFSSEVYGVV